MKVKGRRCIVYTPPPPPLAPVLLNGRDHISDINRFISVMPHHNFTLLCVGRIIQNLKHLERSTKRVMASSASPAQPTAAAVHLVMGTKKKRGRRVVLYSTYYNTQQQYVVIAYATSAKAQRQQTEYFIFSTIVFSCLRMYSIHTQLQCVLSA